jgi:L-cystine uptake protein TcyP (sodium:dicarboxylate symporter family)
MAFAVIHCSVGDVLIALSTLTVALVAVGTMKWPAEGHERVMLATLALGVGYTIFSEWLNIVVRSSWAYSELMPVVPIVGIGLSPLLQWILVPTIALSLARRKAL